MFSRLLFVRLKAAENAHKDGRLDEAFRLATAPDIREHSRGAAVLAKLTDGFLDRARNHFRADRFSEALADLDRAAVGGVKNEEVAELRDHINTVTTEQRRQEESRTGRVQAARRRIEGGSIMAGRKILEEASESDQAADELRRNAKGQADDARRIIAQAEQLAEQGQIAAAVQRLRRAKSIDAQNENVARVEAALCNQVLERARTALNEGRISRASDELACLGDLGDKLPTKRELKDILSLARDAAQCIEAGEHAKAKRHALSLGRLLPNAEWVAEVVEGLARAEETKASLCAGPLGERMGKNRTPQEKGPRSSSLDDTVAMPYRGKSESGLPEALLLLVDGGGSYLIFRGERTTIGRAVSSNPATIPVFSDVAERHASIVRVDDDYFLFTDKDVEVAGRRTPHQLLRNGDRLVLGRKAKMTFRLPSRKSSTAVLDLSDTTKMPNDVRRVVLFHQQATLGSGSNAHIRCRHAGPSIVLFERKGSLWLRQRNDGHVDTEAVKLTLGEPLEIGGVSLVLQPWKIRTPGTQGI